MILPPEAPIKHTRNHVRKMRASDVQAATRATLDTWATFVFGAMERGEPEAAALYLHQYVSFTVHDAATAQAAIMLLVAIFCTSPFRFVQHTEATDATMVTIIDIDHPLVPILRAAVARLQMTLDQPVTRRYFADLVDLTPSRLTQLVAAGTLDAVADGIAPAAARAYCQRLGLLP